MEGVFIAGTGYHHPAQVLSNDDLVARLPTTHEWILGHTGIRERRIAAADVDTSDLAVEATQAALSRSGWSGKDLDLLICATSTPDTLAPATAAHVAEKMGLGGVHFDVNASCSNFVYGVAVARGLMAAQGLERIALCTAEKYSRVVDYDDRRFAIFWGDGAATVLLTPEAPTVGAEVLDVRLSSHNADANLVITPVHGWFTMDGAAVKPIATRLLVDSAHEILAAHDLEVGDLRAFMAHQMNLRLLEDLTEILGVTDDQHWHNVEWRGNQGGAGIVTALCAGIEDPDVPLRDGDLLLMSVVGSGFSAGSVLLRWIDRSPGPA